MLSKRDSLPEISKSERWSDEQYFALFYDKPIQQNSSKRFFINIQLYKNGAKL